MKPRVQKLLNTIICWLANSPSPRTYDGNPSAGATESPAERDYEEAKRISNEKDHVVSHTWRW